MWAATFYFATAPTQVTSITSGKYYVIDGLNQLNGGTPGHFLFDNGSKVTSNNPQQLPTDYTAGKFVWKIVGNSTDGWTLQNLATKNYMSLGSSDGSVIATSATSQTNGIYFSGDYATILNNNGQAIDIGYYGNNPTTWGGNQTPAGSRRLVFYEVTIVEIADNQCYTIDFISHDGTKTWGLKSGTTEQKAVENGTGDVYVAHSYTNLSGETRWIFVNNNDGTFLAYHGQATKGFNYFHAISEFKIEGMRPGMSSYTRTGADYNGKVCITNGKRNTSSTDLGTYILKESNGAYDNSSAPYYNANTNNYFTSALIFAATEDEISTAASNAINQFDNTYYGPRYIFDTSNGAFFQNLTANQQASATTYCNLWISKNTQGKPQLKIITNDATSSGGNNIRSTGGLYTTASLYQYNLSINEGRIISYTIVGTAAGNLSITPAGGSAEEFTANANVSKTIVLASPAKQTSFSLSGSNQWLNVTGITIQYESDATPVSSLSDITNDGIYTITCYTAERGGMYAGTTYIDACGGHANTNYPANKSTALDATDQNQQFAIYTHGNNKYLYNIGRNKFVGVADGLYYKMTGAPINKWSVSNGAYNGYFHLTSQDDNKMATMNAWVATGTADSKAYAITGQDANEDANNFALLRVGTLSSAQTTAIETIFTNYETLQNSLTTLGNYTIGSALGEYNHATFATNEAKQTAITNIQDGLKACAASDIPTANTSVQTLITGMNINLPTGKFIRLKGGNSSQYPYYGDKIESRYPMTSDGTLPTTIFYNDGTHLLSYSSGIYWGVTGGDGTSNWDWTAAGGTGSTITFAKSNVPGQYFIELTTVDDNYPYVLLYDHGTSKGRCDRSKYTTISSITDNHMNWTLEEVSSLPLELAANSYTSFSAPVPITIPEDNGEEKADYYAYYATSQDIDAGVINMKRVTGNIPANTGLIIYTKVANPEIQIAASGTELKNTNLLQPNVAASNVSTEGNYFFGKVGSSYIFTKLTGSDTYTLPGHKAYLQLSSRPSRLSLSWDYNESTGIHELNDEIIKLTDGKYYQNNQVVIVRNGVKYNVAGQKIK